MDAMRADELRQNRRWFEAGIRRLEETMDAEAGLDLAYRLMFFAQDGGCGYFASSAIERRLCAFSDELPPPKEVEAKPNSVLIVMTAAYLIGGHTRVVERWIEQDPSRRYSLALTDQGDAAEIPERLRTAVARSGGEILVLDVHETRMARARKLRDFALAFEKVVLHIHMYDVISFVAFGSEAFPRPVGFYNHADHVPWLGVSISDCVAELREWGSALSRECRGVRESVLVGIPCDEKMDVNRGATEAGAAYDVRKRYGISPTAPLVFTCGREVKYQPVAGLDFLDVVRGILSADAEAVVLAVGPVAKNVPGWEAASRAFGGRLKTVPPVPFGELAAFYKAADLVLDSYPMGGSTALADALTAGCPVLSALGLFGKDDWVLKIKGYCGSVQELVEKALALLKDRSLAHEYAAHDLEVYRAAHSPQQFKERLESFFARLSGQHRIHPFKESVGLRPEIDLGLWEESQTTETIIRGIPKVFSCVRHRTPLASERILTLFGHDFVFHKRLTPVGKMLLELASACPFANVREITFLARGDARGSLIPLEADSADVPFEVKRAYFIFDTTPGTVRGHHAHKSLRQMLICVSGACTIDCEMPDGTVSSHRLDWPTKGLLVEGLVWHTMRDFSKDAVLFVLASEHYSEADYVRDHAEFLRLARGHGAE